MDLISSLAFCFNLLSQGTRQKTSATYISTRKRPSCSTSMGLVVYWSVLQSSTGEQKHAPSIHPCIVLKRLALPSVVNWECRGFERDGDGFFSAEEAEFAKETTDRDNEETLLGEARVRRGEPLVPSGEVQAESSTTPARAALVETSDALHEIEEVYQAIEDVSHSLSEQLL